MRIIISIIITLLFVSFADAAEDMLTKLKDKGLKEEVLKNLNGACLKMIDFDFRKDHSFWQSVWNREDNFLILDFLQGTKHYTLMVKPVGKEGCVTSRTITAYWVNPCPALKERYQKSFPKGSIKVREVQDIFMWLSNAKGTDIYLYKTPGGCVEIFREVYSLKE